MKILFVLTFLLAANFAHAFVANCTNTLYSDDGVAIKSEQNILCKIGKLKNERFYYRLKIRTYGVDLDWTTDDLILTCPLVSMKRLKKVLDQKGKWTVYQAQVSATVVGGLKAGVAINERGAVCTLTGFTIGIGASAGIGDLTITRSQSNRWEELFEW